MLMQHKIASFRQFNHKLSPMKKLFIPLFASFLLLVLSMSAMSAEKPPKGKKVIENKLYSLVIPDDWTPFKFQKEDGTPFERNGGPYYLYVFHWQSPIDKNNFTDGYSIFLQSYERLNGEAATMADMEEEIRRNNDIPGHVSNVKRTELKAKAGQKRILITRKGDAVSADKGTSYRQERIYYLIQPDGKRMHLLSLSLTEDYYKRQPDADRLIQEIFDSFRVKGAPVRKWNDK